MRIVLTALFIICLTAVAAFSAVEQAEEHTDAKVTVFVSVLPQKYLLDRIAGDLAHVYVMVGPGQSPATYSPTPRQMTALGKARLYFSIGVPFEKVWMSKIADISPGLRIIDLRNAETEGAVGNHLSGGHLNEEDPHVWTSPPLAGRLALRMMDALVHADPANRRIYEVNCSMLMEDLNALDKEIRSILGSAKGSRFVVFHPAWGHFAREYGLHQIAIESHGKSPGPRALDRVIRNAREAGIKVIYVQSQFSRRDADAVARAIGARVAALDPLAEDYIDNMMRVARELAKEMR